MPLYILSVLAVVKHHFAVAGEDGERQRIVVDMPVAHLFLFPERYRRGAQFIEMHGAQAAGEQQLLGIKQLIQLFTGLLPGDHAGHAPGGGGQHGKQQRQAQAQAQAGKSFHASPRV